MSFLLDTDIAIWHLRGHPQATNLLADLAKDGPLAISTVTRLEIRQGMLGRELVKTEQFLDSVINLPLDVPTANLAGDWLRSWRKKGVTLDTPDAIIAASAHLAGYVLVTGNGRHYPMPELIRKEVSFSE